MNISSKLIETAVNAFATLPGIGKKTALRLTLHLINSSDEQTEKLADSITRMKKEIKFCKECHNISDADICSICNDSRRDKELICVVESIRDVMAIEETSQFSGVYHVLGGIISPIDGIGPDDIQIESLIDRIKRKEVKEVLMAISPTIEGDTTIFYITKLLKDYPLKVSTIARGVAFGGELEYADGVTLGRSIVARVPYNIDGA